MPVAGFQFDVSGIILSSVSGGIAEEEGFSVSNNITGTVIGFSLQGATIPPGEHVLTILSFEALEASGNGPNVFSIDTMPLVCVNER